jgi:hypothetical protein
MTSIHKHDNSGDNEEATDDRRPVTVFAGECGDWSRRESSFSESFVTAIVFAALAVVMYIMSH